MKKVSFTNPVCRGADPWMFLCGEYFYLCCTAGRSLWLYRSKDPSKITAEGECEKVLAFRPREGEAWSKDLWSPEIHHFTEEEFPGHGGWYLFIACDDGKNVNHRMYVLKCEDRDTPFAPYGEPLTGERYVPKKIESETDGTFNAGWCCGQTILRHNGKVYCMWVDEVGRQTMDFHQRDRIALLKNPWTAGDAGVIIKPTEEWETHGFGMGSDGVIRPRVVEGGTAVYGENGELYVVYSGSGYWTKYYALGQITLEGDPLVYEDWKKEKEPLFSMSNTVFGCGHASFFTDAEGKRFIAYHAYLSPDRAGGRYVFIEPYRIENGRIVIGDGSGKPAPLDTVQTVTVY